MITCTHCLFSENPDTARYCAHCGASLPIAMAVRSGTHRLGAPRPTSSLQPRIKHIGNLGPHEIALYVAEYEEPLIVNVTHETILGRISRVASVTPQPAIDLTMFQAIELGVSRAHAALRRYMDDLLILDLDSTNGTWVNGVRLKAQTPVKLQSGDRISLAKLTLYTYFQ